jgi:hypothetical protein
MSLFEDVKSGCNDDGYYQFYVSEFRCVSAQRQRSPHYRSGRDGANKRAGYDRDGQHE